MDETRTFRSTDFHRNRLVTILYDIVIAGLLLIVDWFLLQMFLGLLIPGMSFFLILIPLLFLFIALNFHYGFFMDILSRGNQFFELSNGTLICHPQNGEVKVLRFEQLKGVTLTEVPHRMSMSYFVDFAAQDANLVFRLGDFEEEKSLIAALENAGFRKINSLPIFGRKTFALK